MSDSLVRRSNEGDQFQFGDDFVTIKAGSQETGGSYSLVHWVVAGQGSAPVRSHGRYEETFYLLRGSLEFFLEDCTIEVREGDFVRAPAGTRHGYANHPDEPVEMLVGFTPGGMEELFGKYRTDEGELNIESYLAEAKSVHETTYEMD